MPRRPRQRTAPSRIFGRLVRQLQKLLIQRRRRSGTGPALPGRLRGTLRVVLVIAVLAAVNYYVLYVRHGTSVPALLRAAEVGRLNSPLPGLNGPPGTPPTMAAARPRKIPGQVGPVVYSRAVDVPLSADNADPEALAQVLHQHGVAEKLSHTISETLQQVVHTADMEQSPDAEAALSLFYDQEDTLLSVDYRRSREQAFRIERSQAGSAELWTAERRDKPLQIQTVAVSGTVSRDGGLAEAVQRAGEVDSLTSMLTEVFGYELDLPTESRTGDRFQIVVEKHLLGGGFYRYGKLLAAQYEGHGAPLRAFRFVVPGQGGAFRFDAETGYYSDKGESLARSWLRSPLRLSNRAALALAEACPQGTKTRPAWPAPHLDRRLLTGMDYTAPAGTPVRAVAVGKVLGRSAKPAAGGGLVLTVSHSGAEASYGRLARTARGITEGTMVRPGQVIGYVAAVPGGPHRDRTARAHLHFAVRVAGKITDPQKLRPVREAPVPAVQRSAFNDVVKPLQARLMGPPIARLP